MPQVSLKVEHEAQSEVVAQDQAQNEDEHLEDTHQYVEDL